MIVAFDNTFLTLVLNPASPSRANPATGLPTPHCRQRIEALIDSLSGASANQVVIPTPALAETLVVSEDVDKIIATLRSYTAVEIAPFDSRSALELAIMTREAIKAGDKRSGSNLDWQLIKLDRQIVAIARAHGASVLYTDDGAQTTFAERCGLVVKHTWDLELPAAYAQIKMDLEDETA